MMEKDLDNSELAIDDLVKYNKKQYIKGIDPMSIDFWSRSQMSTYMLDSTKIVIVHCSEFDGPSLVDEIKKALDNNLIPLKKALQLKELAESPDPESKKLARNILEVTLNKLKK